MATADYQVQSLARAAAILTAFSADQPALTIGEIARRCGLPRSTVHRLVVNLVRLGFLARDPLTDHYRLGLLMVELGAIALSRLDLRERAMPAMERLAERTGEAVFLAVLDHNASVYVQKVEGRQGLRMTAHIGRRAPLHCTASGKVLLASLPDEQVRRIAAETGLPAATARTITAIGPLLAHLAEVRRRGYAVDGEESEEGLVGIAAPVRGADGATVAALTIAGPSSRLLPGGRSELAPLVVATADDASGLLGFRHPSGAAAPGT